MADLEYALVERPLIEQLTGMGWRHLEGAPPEAVVPTLPYRSGRASFSEVILEDVLRTTIAEINLDAEGQPWLDEARISSAVNQLTRLPASSLLEANEKATELLINGHVVEGVPGWEGGKGRRVHYIDWEHPENNDFTVVNQFRADIPGSQGNSVVPDLVLFVNGIPLVVVECKQPKVIDLTGAVNQIRDYAEQRRTDIRTGNQKLFHTVQLTVVTSGEEAKLGTFTATEKHYVPWRDPYPLTAKQLAATLGKPEDTLSRQEILAGAVLDKARLLDIVHNFVTSMTTERGAKIKAAPRYQQYRAVAKTVERLLTGKTRLRHGRQDQRGGIIWHTQGSGKSLTMTFLVRRLRATPALADAKVVVVTDRTQLQGQLSETMELAGEHLDVATSGAKAQAALRKHGPGVVFVMIQKNQDTGSGGTGMAAGTPLGELNTDESIVVLIDEAHRSHSATLGANLREALPNAARIGFTGTPIMTRNSRRKTSVDLFGPFIDKYRLKDAEDDGVIVPIVYEVRTVRGAVRDGRELDDIFEEDLEGLTEEEREQLQRRYATKGKVSAAEQLIAAKAKNILRHYVEKILPERFKAQVVAEDREATVRYREALLAARDELVGEIERLPPKVLATPLDEVYGLRKREAYLVRASRQLDLLRRIDFVPVISEGNSEREQQLAEWTDPVKRKARIDGFTQPYEESEIGFVIVQAMLLTGFDAPIEQVMYLDRGLKEAELLQAVARVNRTSDGKDFGYVVDYHGVAENLLQALRLYAREDYDSDDAADVENAMRDPQDEIHKLEPRRTRLRMLFSERGVDADDVESCVQLLADDELRDKFTVELARFLKTVNAVLPDPAAKPFLPDAKHFTVVKVTAVRRYRVDGGEFNPSAYGEKIRELIDDHVVSLGIELTLPPVALTAPDFAEKVDKLPGPRAKASEMEHAIRHHISVHAGEDPHRYQLLSERLKKILEELADDIEAQVRALQGLLTEIVEERPENPHGLGDVETALYGVLLGETATSADDAQDTALVDVTRKVYALAVETVHRTDFWKQAKRTDQEKFRRRISGLLFEAEVCDEDDLKKISSQLLDVIRHNQRRIPKL
ncbi:type I restriction endonuclease subunit R [Microbispora sp. NBC_01189]|uniref:type I restriction endonuclease subunit R n=1 Tax=Microbispora sp. NBC_01189 TaxID=2903583 RepID=UPI002E10637D|nr:type I restriction endonuclease subunit R [Microbispora sp. NBC_01189]